MLKAFRLVFWFQFGQARNVLSMKNSVLIHLQPNPIPHPHPHQCNGTKMVTILVGQPRKSPLDKGAIVPLSSGEGSAVLSRGTQTYAS